MKLSLVEIVGSGRCSLTGDACRFSLSVFGEIPTTNTLMVELALETPKLPADRERRDLGVHLCSVALSLGDGTAGVIRKNLQDDRSHCPMRRLHPPIFQRRRRSPAEISRQDDPLRRERRGTKRFGLWRTQLLPGSRVGMLGQEDPRPLRGDPLFSMHRPCDDSKRAQFCAN